MITLGSDQFLVCTLAYILCSIYSLRKFAREVTGKVNVEPCTSQARFSTILRPLGLSLPHLFNYFNGLLTDSRIISVSLSRGGAHSWAAQLHFSWFSNFDDTYLFLNLLHVWNILSTFFPFSDDQNDRLRMTVLAWKEV